MESKQKIYNYYCTSDPIGHWVINIEQLLNLQHDFFLPFRHFRQTRIHKYCRYKAKHSYTIQGF